MFQDLVFSVNKTNTHIVFCLMGIKFKFKKNKKLIKCRNIMTSELFKFQYIDKGIFNRFDTIVRLLAIENYYGLNNYGWDLYLKMQNKTGVWSGHPEDAKKRFVDLIKSWEQKGYNKKSRILVNKDYELLDGSHRLALLLYNRQKCVNIQIDLMSEFSPLYGKKRFIDNGFTEEEFSKIEQRYNKVISEIDSI